MHNPPTEAGPVAVSIDGRMLLYRCQVDGCDWTGRELLVEGLLLSWAGFIRHLADHRSEAAEAEQADALKREGNA
jgi:hypothetical protein